MDLRPCPNPGYAPVLFGIDHEKIDSVEGLKLKLKEHTRSP